MLAFLTTNTVKHKYFDSLEFGKDVLMRGQFLHSFVCKAYKLELDPVGDRKSLKSFMPE